MSEPSFIRGGTPKFSDVYTIPIRERGPITPITKAHLRKSRGYTYQGHHERQDRKDRGLAWIWQNRKWLCGGPVSQKSAVAALPKINLVSFDSEPSAKGALFQKQGTGAELFLKPRYFDVALIQ